MARKAQKIKNDIIYWFVVYLLLFVRLVSRETAFLFFQNLGILAFHLIRSERQKTLRNLRLIFGNCKSEVEINRLACHVFSDIGRNAVDALRIPILKRHDLAKIVRIEGLENLDRALAKGKGVIVVTGHIGSWEFMAATISVLGYPVFVVGKPIYDPRLDRIVVGNREAAGSRNIARGTGIREIFKALRGNSILGILIDQDTNVDGVFVDFFGKKAYTPVGPALLASKTGASIVPMAIHLLDNQVHRIVIRKPLELVKSNNGKYDLIAITQEASDFIEEMVRLYPSQWVWMHERWKTQPRNDER